LPPANGPAGKARILVVGVGDQRRVLSLATIAARADEAGTWATTVGDVDVRLTYRDGPPVAFVEPVDPSRSLETVHSFWFAWYATHPDTTIE
jgi:hypothetical protein